MFGVYQSNPNQLDEAAALGILKHLNNQDLQKLLDDEDHLSGYIKDVQQLKSMAAEKETIIASNRSLAEYNLSFEPRLYTGRRQLATVYKNAIDIQKEYEQKKQKLDVQSAEQSLDTTLCLLQTEMAKSEEDSEVIAENFVSGDLEIEDFVTKFTEKRKEAHLRRIKSEKMSELLRERTRQQQLAAATTYPMNQGNPGQAQWNQNSWNAGYAANGPSANPMPYPANYYPR